MARIFDDIAILGAASTAAAERSRTGVDPTKVFDWDKAARLIKQNKPSVVEAFLAGDEGYTGGKIFLNGKPVPHEDTYTYLASLWATPKMRMDGVEIECWILKSESPDWDSDTYWPESALKILDEG